MTYGEGLIAGGVKYPTIEAAEQARHQMEAAALAARERRDKLAASFEAELRERFLATGATDADWQKQRASIVAKAREVATLERGDVARSRNGQRYSG